MKTIKEVREARSKLEQDIEALINTFSKENDVRVTDVVMSTVGFYDPTSHNLNAECSNIEIKIEL